MGGECFEFGPLGVVFGAFSEVGPLVGIGVDVVELLASLGILDIAPSLGRETVSSRLVDVGQRDMRPMR